MQTTSSLYSQHHGKVPQKDATPNAESLPLLPPSAFMTRRDGTKFEETTITETKSGFGLGNTPNVVWDRASNGALDMSVTETETELLSPADELIYIKEQLAQYKDAKLKLRWETYRYCLCRKYSKLAQYKDAKQKHWWETYLDYLLAFWEAHSIVVAWWLIAGQQVQWSVQHLGHDSFHNLS